MEILYGPIAILIYIFAGIPVIFGYSLYRKTRPGYLTAIFLDSTDNLISKRVKIADDGKSFSFKSKKGGKKYNISEDCIYRVGKFRIPTSYYNVGKVSPLDFNQMKSATDRTDLDYFEATEGNVIRQALQAFDETFLTITSSTVVIAIVVIAANGLVYVQLKSLLDQISIGLGIQAP